jgi:RNA polymerase subunit RPABC4/transcription elongation factor Spt4
LQKQPGATNTERQNAYILNAYGFLIITKEKEGMSMSDTKFCKHCGEIIDADCVVCPKCGKQVEKLAGSDAPIIINNSSSSSSSASASASVSIGGRRKDKWVSLLLCIFTVCGHKFYEGKIGMGVLYLLTAGLFGIGWLIDIIALLGKPNPYYV